jgi:hypothetical protein
VLRLRGGGGGGGRFFIIDLLSKVKESYNLVREVMTFTKLKEQLCIKHNCLDVIIFLDGKIIPKESYSEGFMRYPELAYESSILSFIPISYKQVVFCQNADGSWDEKLA